MRESEPKEAVEETNANDDRTRKAVDAAESSWPLGASVYAVVDETEDQLNEDETDCREANDLMGGGQIGRLVILALSETWEGDERSFA